MKAIADTGFLVAFANRRDRHHHWAVALARSIEVPLLTCEAVLAETAFHLRNARVVFGMIEGGLVRVSFDCNAHLVRLAELAERYADREPDLADLCLIRMSELYPEHAVATVDWEDFAIYRRNRRDVIATLHPVKVKRRRRS